MATQEKPVEVSLSEEDREAIVQTALDYIEGWYEGDAERMERSLHPHLAKRIVWHDPTADVDVPKPMSALELVVATREGGGTDTPKKQQQKDVTILDVFEKAASVKIVASDWIDYMHLAKMDGEWKIVNVLWEWKPGRGWS